AVDGTSVVGSTYLLQEGAHAMTEAGHAENLLKLDELLGRRAPRRPELSTLRGWAGSRAAVADRLPVVGAVPGIQNLWLACAYGSRGLSWSALAGDVIAAMMLNEPIPLERDLLQKIAPR